ncbi:hypothetical protein ACFQ9X_15800 [Catenulispora yoronensis]
MELASVGGLLAVEEAQEPRAPVAVVGLLGLVVADGDWSPESDQALVRRLA